MAGIPIGASVCGTASTLLVPPQLAKRSTKQLLPQGLLISAPWYHQPFGRLLLVVYKRQKAGMSPLVVAKKQYLIYSQNQFKV